MARSAIMMTVLWLAMPTLAQASDVADFFLSLDSAETSPLCLVAQDPADPVVHGNIIVSRQTKAGAHDSRMTLGISGKSFPFRFGLECRVAGPGGKFIECTIPCGGDASVNLTVGKDGTVKADLVIADGVLGDVGEIKGSLTMKAADPDQCMPARTDTDPKS